MQEPLLESTVRSSVPKAGEAALEAAKRDRHGKLVKRLKLVGNISEAKFNRRLKMSERTWKHGQVESDTYHCWRSMMQRCFDKHCKGYKRYGARGITVCPQWLSFVGFFRDMGPRPASKSIDRINNDGDYEPDNCRWATQAEQARNTRYNVNITFQGETMCVSDWATRLGVGYTRLFWRLAQGWPLEKVLSSNTFYSRGVENANSKLTAKDVRTIRASKLSLTALGTLYHMHRQTMWRIKRGYNYKDIV